MEKDVMPPWLQAAAAAIAALGGAWVLVWSVRARIIGGIRGSLLHPETGIINTLRIALVVPLNARLDDAEKDREELREEVRDDMAAMRLDIAAIRLQVGNLMLASINRGRHGAADQNIMQQNSPWKFVDVKKLVNAFGPPPPDLVEATRQILENGPLPDTDDELMARILHRIPSKRLEERANEIKQPMDVYQAIYCDMLRLIKEWPGGYDQFVRDLQTEDGA